MFVCVCVWLPIHVFEIILSEKTHVHKLIQILNSWYCCSCYLARAA